MDHLEGKQMTLKFRVTKAESEIIGKIADRAKIMFAQVQNPRNKIEIVMDLTVVHANQYPLKLQGLLEADDSNFSHDVGGIYRYLDRDTGQLRDCFVPRFADLKPTWTPPA